MTPLDDMSEESTYVGRYKVVGSPDLARHDAGLLEVTDG